MSGSHAELISSRKVHAVKREDPVSYPYGDALPNEFQWLGWDPEDEDQKKDGQKIHEAFKQWVRNLSHGFFNSCLHSTINLSLRILDYLGRSSQSRRYSGPRSPR